MDIKIKKPTTIIGYLVLTVLIVFLVPCDSRQSQTSKPFFETPPHTANHKQAAGRIHLTESETAWLRAHPDIQLGYTGTFDPKVIVNTDGTGFIPLREFAGGVDDGRKPNGIGKESIISGFQKMMGLPNALVEDQQTAFQAISWCESDLDFADALHLASSMKADKFVTFDDAFIKQTRKFISINIALPQLR
jgi:hypothetical protein